MYLIIKLNPIDATAELKTTNNVLFVNSGKSKSQISHIEKSPTRNEATKKVMETIMAEYNNCLSLILYLAKNIEIVNIIKKPNPLIKPLSFFVNSLVTTHKIVQIAVRIK